MSNFKEWWEKNRAKVLRKRRLRYRRDVVYRENIKAKMRMRRTIERFLKPYLRRESYVAK